MSNIDTKQHIHNENTKELATKLRLSWICLLLDNFGSKNVVHTDDGEPVTPEFLINHSKADMKVNTFRYRIEITIPKCANTSPTSGTQRNPRPASKNVRNITNNPGFQTWDVYSRSGMIECHNHAL